jgi:hypothetical protein
LFGAVSVAIETEKWLKYWLRSAMVSVGLSEVSAGVEKVSMVSPPYRGETMRPTDTEPTNFGWGWGVISATHRLNKRDGRRWAISATTRLSGGVTWRLEGGGCLTRQRTKRNPAGGRVRWWCHGGVSVGCALREARRAVPRGSSRGELERLGLGGGSWGAPFHGMHPQAHLTTGQVGRPGWR